VGSVWVLFGIEVRKQIVRRAKTPVAETPASEIPWWEEEQNVLPEGLPALDIGRNINVRLTTAREQDLAFSALELPPLVPEADGNTVPVLDLA
jgi:hypothetical protein